MPLEPVSQFVGRVAKISLAGQTYDPSPHLDLYRQSVKFPAVVRPTVEDLHESPRKLEPPNSNPDLEASEQTVESVKFGWIRGVFVRGLLGIWGATIFMRMGWMGGQAGLLHSLGMVGLATTITLLTTSSMSVLCTNGRVRGGGPYYLVSRSLGPEIGAAVGILFSLANCSAVAMYVVAAAETVRDILQEHGMGVFSLPSGINDVRLISLGFLILVVFITFMGMNFESQTQLLLLACILAAFASFFIGLGLPPSPAQYARGFLGWNMTVARINLYPAYTPGQNFFTIFSVFFPSVIGILSGASISGDLKDPSVAIPRGTFWSIGTTSLSYALVVSCLCCTVERFAPGDNPNITCAPLPDDCHYGLIPYYQIMEMIAIFGPLIYLGIFAATLSSALASQVAAPRLLQALAKDGVFPKLAFFGKGRGPGDEPFNASILCVVIAFGFMLIGDLNAISPYISLFFIFTFGVINYAAFHASFVRSPGFRPDFRLFNQWVSLLAFLLCLSVMFVMDWPPALVTVVLAAGIIVYTQYSRPDINWGSSTKGAHYKNALASLQKMSALGNHVKNYRPSVLLLCGNPGSRAALVDLSHQLTSQAGMLVCGHILKSHVNYQRRAEMAEVNQKWLYQRKIKAFYSQMECPSLAVGAFAMMQAAGLGKMKPNILLMGFISHYTAASSAKLSGYLNCLHYALDLHLSIAILKVPGTSGTTANFEDAEDFPLASAINQLNEYGRRNKDTARKNAKEIKTCAELNPTVLEAVSRFTQPATSSIDVWWVNDDGGLTLLLPHLLSARKLWSHCPLRVFSIASKVSRLAKEQVSLINLLKKFRISCQEVRTLSGMDSIPNFSTKSKFENLISNWKLAEPTDPNYLAPEILDTYKEKTRRILRLTELLQEHSGAAALVVITLPMPRKLCPAALYIAWLEMLTSGVPPCLLVRGNQEPVLTFYT